MKAAFIASLIVLLVPTSAHKFHGETPEQAAARYDTIAESMATVAGDDARLAAYLLTVARHESTFTLPVHTGKKRGDAKRSWGLYQIMCARYPASMVPGTAYRAGQIVGTDASSTLRATEAAAVHLRGHIKVCKGAPMCVFKRYGGVGNRKKIGPKTQARLNARVATFNRLLTRVKPGR